MITIWSDWKLTISGADVYRFKIHLLQKNKKVKILFDFYTDKEYNIGIKVKGCD